MVSFRAVCLSFVVLMVAACASVVDTPNQNIHFLTPGATGARCIAETDDSVRYVIYPPEKIFIHRMSAPLTVNCEAPGNRVKTIVVHAKLNNTSLLNAATAGVGAAYDTVSGAVYEYPSVVSIDFTHTAARSQGLPKYHSPDTVSPFDQINEDRREVIPAHPEEQGLRKPANILPEKAPDQPLLFEPTNGNPIKAKSE